MFRPIRVVMVLPVVVLVGCGVQSSAGSSASSAPPLPPTVSAPATLLADGTVPWVDEPAGDREFDSPPKARRVDPDAKPCRADQLRGELPSWHQPSGYVEEGSRPQPRGSLIGNVQITNSSQQSCRLQGEVDTRMLAGGTELPLRYSNDVIEEAKTRVTVVPPGERAELRLDWTSIYCAPSGGPIELLIHLPGDGGDLRAPVGMKDAQPCSNDVKRTFLSSGVFDEPPTAGPQSPLKVLTATLEPVAPAKAGAPITYFVRLDNPTDKPVPLDPCPGYYQNESAKGNLDYGRGYRLNCRPVKDVPARGSVPFEMRAGVPADKLPGETMSVGWKLMAPGLFGEVHGRFALPVTE